MAREAAFPSVPTDRLAADGWVETERAVETVVRLPAARVRGATVVYDDQRTRRAVHEATGIDAQCRFFFATRLSFEPPLPPAAVPTMVLPIVLSEARRRFENTLRERGLTDVELERTERVRVDSGDRASLTRYGATRSVRDDASDVETDLSVTGWVGVWHGDGFRIAGGAYPNRPLADTLDIRDPPAAIARDGDDYQDELLTLLRSVA